MDRVAVSACHDYEEKLLARKIAAVETINEVAEQQVKGIHQPVHN